MTTTQAIDERVMSIICDKLAVTRDKLAPSTAFVEDLNADSLDIIELVMEMEHEFDLSIPDEDAEKMKTVGDVINYVVQKKPATH